MWQHIGVEVQNQSQTEEWWLATWTMTLYAAESKIIDAKEDRVDQSLYQVSAPINKVTPGCLYIRLD